jgi:predicted Na+-dependent transporter
MLALCAAAATYDYLGQQPAPLVPPVVFALVSFIVLAAWAFMAAGRASQD